MANSVKNITATGDVSTGPTNLLGIVNGATAGSIVLRNGGAGGTVKATLPVAAAANILLTGGLKFPNGLHATLTTTNNISFVLGDA